METNSHYKRSDERRYIVKQFNVFFIWRIQNVVEIINQTVTTIGKKNGCQHQDPALVLSVQDAEFYLPYKKIKSISEDQ